MVLRSAFELTMHSIPFVVYYANTSHLMELHVLVNNAGLHMKHIFSLVRRKTRSLTELTYQILLFLD